MMYGFFSFQHAFPVSKAAFAWPLVYMENDNNLWAFTVTL